MVEVTGWNRDHARQQLWGRLAQPKGRATATIAVLDRRRTKPQKYSSVIEEFAVEEPNATQIKYYAQGVGNVKVGWRGDDSQREELELVKLSELDAAGLATFRKLALTLETHAYKISKDVYGATKPMA